MDVVVIGGGIVGVTAALSLAETGATVTVVERSTVAGEASGLNAGMITGGGWGNSDDVESALCMGSRMLFLELADDRGHDIGLRRSGALTLVRTEDEWAWAQAHVEAKQATYHSLELLDSDALTRVFARADPSLLGAVFDPDACTAEPVAATQAFCAEAVAAGATVLTGTSVTGLTPTNNGWRIDLHGNESGATELGADAVVIAAGPWCDDLAAMVGLLVPVVAVRGQMWATEPQPPLFGCGISAAESPLAWRDESVPGDEPAHLTHRRGNRITRHVYGRQRPNGEIVFGGDRVLTTDRSLDDDGIAVNHAHVGELIPTLADLEIARTWTGLMPFSLDGQPLIGPIPDHPGLFLAGGLASSGFGRGPMTGHFIATLVLGDTIPCDMAPVLPAGRVRER